MSTAINISPNMNLPIPVPSVEIGPQWASDIVNCLTIIDQHMHAPNYGVIVNPAGININSDLAFNNFNALTLRSSRYSVQPSPLSAPTDIGCVYVSGVDLYYNDINGNQVRLTQSGGVAGSPGSISNLTSPASAAYVSANSTFVWQSAANTSAIMDFSSAIFRNLSANSFGLSLVPPSAMGSDFTLTLPTVPGAQGFMTLDSSGNISGSVVPIANGITRTMLAAVGQQTSSTINYSGTAKTNTLITNASVTITTSGRPVLILLQSDPATSGGGIITVANSTGTSMSVFLGLSKNSGSTFPFQTDLGFAGHSGAGNVTWPASSVFFFDTPSAGTYTYSLYYSLPGSSTGGTFTLNESILVAWEL